MAQCQGPRAQMIKLFVVFAYWPIRQEGVAKILKVPGAPAPGNVNSARAIAWLVGLTIYCTIFQ